MPIRLTLGRSRRGQLDQIARLERGDVNADAMRFAFTGHISIRVTVSPRRPAHPLSRSGVSPSGGLFLHVQGDAGRTD